MCAQQIKKTAGIRIVSIQEDSFTFRNLSPSAIAEFDTNNLYVSISVSLDKEGEDILVIYPSVVYDYLQQGKKKIDLMSISSIFKFRINTSDKSFEGNSEIILTRDVIETVIPSALATVRGMMVVKTAGTFLSKYPLQLLEAKEIVDNLELELWNHDKPSAKATKAIKTKPSAKAVAVKRSQSKSQ